MQTGDINNALIDVCKINASKKGYVEMITVLLDLGADMNCKDEVKSQ